MGKRAKANWQYLDKDLNRLNQLELTTDYVVRPLVGAGLALVFIVLAGVTAAVALGSSPSVMLVAVGAVLAAYLAVNIGANDVSNNMGPAVGAGAISLTSALILAAVAETAGALIGGREVVATISHRLIQPDAILSGQVLAVAMVSALISAALWVNFATWIGAPVSTTHSVIGSVLGVTVASSGWAAVNMPMLGLIASAWVIAPLFGALIAVLLLALVRNRITDRADKIAAAATWVPIFGASMAGLFSCYLLLKLPDHVLSAVLLDPDHRPSGTITVLSLLIAGLAYAALVPLIRAQVKTLAPDEKSVRRLFRLPLVTSAVLLSFAHGANDVANAAGPLAAIVISSRQGDLALTAVTFAVPDLVAAIGAFGLMLGVLLFGPRLIRMVGKQITKLNPIRSFCVAASTAFTVILASWMGLPLSTTHVAVGSVFGIGFYREYQSRQSRRPSVRQVRLAPEDRHRRRLVRRSHFLKIMAAWMVTVPAVALFAAGVSTVLLWFF